LLSSKTCDKKNIVQEAAVKPKKIILEVVDKYVPYRSCGMYVILCMHVLCSRVAMATDNVIT
jgi:hypothetical protein